MATIKEIKELALHAAKGTAPANYSTENVDEALREELNAMCGSINQFMRNKDDLFEIMIETADEVVPQKVIDRISLFAEVRVVPQNTKVMFTRKLGKNRAKAFVTRVGLSGVYETFRLDAESFDVGVHAVGSAGQIDFERMLDGTDSMADIMEVILEGLEDSVYVEVERLLIESLNNAARPKANQVISNGFDAAKMADLVNVVRAYGSNAVIFATPNFVSAMGPDAIVAPIVGAAQGIYAPDDIDAIHNTGYIRIFRGTPVVMLPNGFIDEMNEKTWFNDQFAFVLPAGREKIVKFVFEGATQMWSRDNEDQSMEIRFYKKMGGAIMVYNNWGIYQNTALADNSYNPYGF